VFAVVDLLEKPMRQPNHGIALLIAFSPGACADASAPEMKKNDAPLAIIFGQIAKRVLKRIRPALRLKTIALFKRRLAAAYARLRSGRDLITKRFKFTFDATSA
jgi:hypothetical protein